MKKSRIKQPYQGGYHNADLAKTTQRLLQGGSWKKQRVIVLIPSGPLIPAKVYLSHCSLIFPPNQPVHRILAEGMEVGEAYSNAIQMVLDHPELSQYEFVLTIEHDNIPPQDGVIRLIKRMEEHPEFACIGGSYFTKGIDGVLQAWGDPKDGLNFRPQLPDPNGGLVECNGTGMGFNLWRLQMFKDEKLRKPWFKTIADHTGVGTQDLYAWSDFKKHNYRCAIDCSVKTGHFEVETGIIW